MLRIRALQPEDFAAADDVLRAAFHASISFVPRLRRYLALQPDGWLVADDEGQVVGMVGAIDYGAFAYVGLMAVRPDRQGQRLGRKLLDALLADLDGRGRPCALLDASPAGAPLYERSGFADAGLSHEFSYVEDPSAAQVPAARAADPGPRGGIGGATPPADLFETAVRSAWSSGGNDGETPTPPADSLATATVALAGAADVDDIVALDASFLGAPRERLWRWLFASHRILAARDAEGALAGYLCAQDPLLGPFGARAPSVAAGLITAAQQALGHRNFRLQVPEENTEGRALLAQLGFRETRTLRHMRRGPFPTLPGWRSIYGKGSYCLG
jgi:predicted N-acetyltransferase YhbS